MSWIPYNENPMLNRVGDCTVRAIAKGLDIDWDDAYWGICLQGFIMANMPSGNAVWGSYLRQKGMERYMIPASCPDDYTLQDFCRDHPNGVYIVALGSHVVAVENGDYYDTWDSGNEIPIYYFTKEE